MVALESSDVKDLQGGAVESANGKPGLIGHDHFNMVMTIKNVPCGST